MKIDFMRIVGVLAVGVCTTLAQAADSQLIEKNTNTQGISAAEQIKALENLDDQAFQALAVGVYKSLQEIQGTLLSQLESSDKEARCRAAYLLGEYRLPGATAKLSQAITLEANPRLNDRQWFWDRYPAAEALARIGSPSIPAMTRNLEESDDKLARDLSLKVLCSVEGDKEVVKLRLQRALDAQKDAKKQARLQSALKSLSEMAADPMP
ncbi:MAG TPA: HEAT repeat domain-containing protein [Verrucomicrobiae bacterium]|nr:HEAT repeat domain-containing protein [Verrucomicrobiae bacterium]